MGGQNLQVLVDGQWSGGVDSFLHPVDLIQGTYAWLVNGINRGGVVQTRPAKRRIKSFCGRKAQGHFWARTLDDRNYEMVAIDGKIYWSPFPFKDWYPLPNVNFRPDAERIWFCNAEQAVEYDAGNNIVVIEPKNIVFMQDGISLPCYWDTSDYSNGIVQTPWVTGIQAKAKPMPVGTAMAWQDNRMWIAVENLVFASDLLHPQSFQEETYLAEKTGFRLPRAIVNMIPSPEQGLLVLTNSSMHALKTWVQDRAQWQTTDKFQSDVNTEVGLIAPWAIAYLHGMPWILTARGVISYDRALTTNLTTVLLTVDGELQRSKNLMGPDVTRACMGVWENVLMLAVPASCIRNRHTWVLDAGVAEKLNNTVGMCWNGIWTGTYPVQFTSPIIAGTQHNYELAYSAGYLAINFGDSPSPQPETDMPTQAYIHLFENFAPNQITHVENPIHCSFETRAFTLASDEYYRFVFGEFMIINLKGIVPVQVYVVGLGGNYQLLFKTTLRADIGPWGNPDQQTKLYYVAQGKTTEFENYRRQVRHMRTQEFVVHESADNASCTEINRLNGIDKAFQLMIQWQGRMGLRQLKFFYDRQLQAPQGQCPVDESGTPHIVLEATA